MASRKRVRPAPASRFLPLLLLLSGFCGISYEILYTRLLGNLLGNHAMSGSMLGCAAVAFVLLLVPAFLVGCSVSLFAGFLAARSSGNVFALTYGVYNVGAALHGADHGVRPPARGRPAGGDPHPGHSQRRGGDRPASPRPSSSC